MRRTPALLATLPLLALGLAGCGGGADRTFTDVDASVCDSLDLDQAITAQFPDAQVGKVKPTFDQGWICRVTVTKASVEKGIALTTVSVLVRVTDDDASATQAYGQLRYQGAEPQTIKGWWSEGVVESTGGAGVHLVQGRAVSHNAVVDAQAQFTKNPTANGDHADEAGRTLVEALLTSAKDGLKRTS